MVDMLPLGYGNRFRKAYTCRGRQKSCEISVQQQGYCNRGLMTTMQTFAVANAASFSFLQIAISGYSVL